MKNISNKKNKPIKEQDDVKQSNDQHIDQDFPGFPNPPSAEKNINPETENEKKEAGLDINEERSDGSANAFTTSENMEQDDDDNPYFRKNK